MMPEQETEPQTGRDEPWFLPLVDLVLRHGKGLDEGLRTAIRKELEEEAARLWGRDPELPPEAVATALHTRLRELMAESRLARTDRGCLQLPAEEEAPEGAPKESPSGAPPPAARRRSEALRVALEALPPIWKEILRLQLVAGADRVAIARALGMSTEEVGEAAEAALARLATAWLESGPEKKRWEELPPCNEPYWSHHFAAYVRGDLDPDRKNVVEEHAFRCRRCATRLLALQQAYDMKVSSSPPSPVKQVREKRATAWIGGFLVTGIALFLVLLAVQSVLGKGERLTKAREVSVLRPIRMPTNPPLPEDPALRELWKEAVTSYQRGDYAKAAERLAKLYDSGAEIPNLGLYLGVSQLLAGQAKDAARTLARQVPEGAPGVAHHFYRAQALLMLGRVEEAREELRAVLASGASVFRRDAERQLTVLMETGEG
jgi:DNA-directed RNA polymerase specialized sigma24 family protein